MFSSDKPLSEDIEKEVDVIVRKARKKKSGWIPDPELEIGVIKNQSD